MASLVRGKLIDGDDEVPKDSRELSAAAVASPWRAVKEPWGESTESRPIKAGHFASLALEIVASEGVFEAQRRPSAEN